MQRGRPSPIQAQQPTAIATGISGGEGMDNITNSGTIIAAVNSKATAVAVSVGVTVAKEGNASGAALSNTSSVSSARAIGIDGGEDDDIINNKGTLNLLASSDAQSVAVTVGLSGTMKGTAEGKSIAESSAKATATSIGIDGGEGNDRLSPRKVRSRRLPNRLPDPKA